MLDRIHVVLGFVLLAGLALFGMQLAYSQHSTYCGLHNGCGSSWYTPCYQCYDHTGQEICWRFGAMAKTIDCDESCGTCTNPGTYGMRLVDGCPYWNTCSLSSVCGCV